MSNTSIFYIRAEGARRVHKHPILKDTSDENIYEEEVEFGPIAENSTLLPHVTRGI